MLLKNNAIGKAALQGCAHRCRIGPAALEQQHGFGNRTPYAAAKWGVIGLTKSAALESAAQGIRINVIAPGLVATERFELIRSQQSALLDARINPLYRAAMGATEEAILNAVCMAEDMEG